MRWITSLALMSSLLLSGCGDTDSEPVAENGASQASNGNSARRGGFANSMSEQVGTMLGQPSAADHQAAPPATTEGATQDPHAPDPNKEQVEATADTVGTKGKGYGGGIITEPISQYFRLQDRIKLQNIEHGVRIFQAQHGRYPASMQEFEDEILKPQQVKLPELPPGRKYVYDPQQGKLFVQSE